MVIVQKIVQQKTLLPMTATQIEHIFKMRSPSRALFFLKSWTNCEPKRWTFARTCTSSSKKSELPMERKKKDLFSQSQRSKPYANYTDLIFCSYTKNYITQQRDINTESLPPLFRISLHFRKHCRANILPMRAMHNSAHERACFNENN